MLTKLVIRNFKRFEEVEVPLGNPVVLVGPNNSGKTTALQALALWREGLIQWQEKRSGSNATLRTGVAINRLDLTAVPVPALELLWRNVKTSAVAMEVLVEGIWRGAAWSCGLKFSYNNSESLYCDLKGGADIPEGAKEARIAYLPPMSGLMGVETQLPAGAIRVRIGEGRTAEVLRNLCFDLVQRNSGKWDAVKASIHRLFGVELQAPLFNSERGELTMGYLDERGIPLDLSSSGRGLQQTLLLLAYLGQNPGATVLLDEPDAHLELVRQRELYREVRERAREFGGQIIAASHSEVLLEEAADQDTVVAFVGRPHRIDKTSKSQVLKSLKEIGYVDCYQAEIKGWVLYLEGSSDLSCLQAFAKLLNHPARQALDQPFVVYVRNNPKQARNHFYAMREAKPDLRGFLLVDYTAQEAGIQGPLLEHSWKRREIENYFVTAEVLVEWAREQGRLIGPLFEEQVAGWMLESVAEMDGALQKLGKGSISDPMLKISDEFLGPVFRDFFGRMELPNTMGKGGFAELIRYLRPKDVDSEVMEVLDAIAGVASGA